MTGSGRGGHAALERDSVLRTDGVEVGQALLKIESLSKTFGRDPGPDRRGPGRA